MPWRMLSRLASSAAIPSASNATACFRSERSAHRLVVNSISEPLPFDVAFYTRNLYLGGTICL